MKFKNPVIVLVFFFLACHISNAQYEPPPVSITIPDVQGTSIGTLNFKDGAPDDITAQKLYDNLDLLHAQNVFLNTFQGASTYAIGEGFKSIGVEDNTFAIFSNLMDSKSLFLTANADGIYLLSIINLTKGPMVVETPPMSLGIFNDMWFNWISDAGTPGPDRGEGGKYLLIPPDYKGTIPDGGYYVCHSFMLKCKSQYFTMQRQNVE